jgi:hypothetical protein
MRNSKLTDLKSESTLPLPLWRVIHLAYPRATQEYSYLALRWVNYRKIKLPQVFIGKKTLEKREATVNYDLLCERMEALLNSQAANGYELFSMSSTNSGLLSISHTPTRSQHPFSRKRLPNATAEGAETLMLIFKKNINC